VPGARDNRPATAADQEKMKLATFSHENKTSVGLILGGRILDLSAAQPNLPRDMIALFSAGECALQAVAQAQSKPAHLSKAFALEVSDLIATGTATDVGILMQPQSLLTAGNVVRCEIEGPGHIENTVRPESPGRSPS
jgi:hypothetical protein